MTSSLTWLRNLAAAATIGSTMATSAMAQTPSGEPIKVGILHSLSGTMAISETTLKDAMLMLIEEQNKKGGVLGRPLEAVVVDPASDWPLFAEKAKQLLLQDEVAVVDGVFDHGVALDPKGVHLPTRRQQVLQ